MVNRMNYLTFIFSLLLTVPCFANSRDVKITSFNFTGSRNRTAELCGKITGEAKSLDIVDVIADPADANPGRYSTLVSPEGTFCIVINTLSGKADAKLRGEATSVSTKIKAQF